MTDVNPQETAPTDSQEQTPSHEAPSAALTADQIKDHPAYKELEGKIAAAEREAKRYKGRLDKVQKGDDDSEPQFVTKAELDAKAWELAHAKDIEVYGDETYKKEIAEGIPPAKALEYAILRFQANPDSARTARQQTMAAPGAGSTRDLSDIEITDEDREDMKKWGYTEETVKLHKKMKKERGI